MRDKREYRRFIFESSIFLKFESNPAKIIEGKLLEISFLGLGIFLKDDVNVDELVGTIVQFDSPDPPDFPGGHLVGKGKIINVKKHRLYAQDGFRIGLEFIEVDKEVVIENLDRLESKRPRWS